MSNPQKTTRVSSIHAPCGIEIWHVEDYTVPVVSVEFAFMGGAAQDPEGKAGLAHLMSGLLDEGAGALNSEAYQEALEDKAIELSFDAGRDRLDGSLRTLSEHIDAAFDLLSLALNAPRFDLDAIERVKGQIVASLKQDESDPQSRARDALYRIGFAGHSYARPVDGKIEDLAQITRDDITRQHHRLMARSNLRIVAVGAISAQQLIACVERSFAALPAHPELIALPMASLQSAGMREVVDLDIPQSTLYLALPGLHRHDPDFMAASVSNHILGGGSFTSRLWTEVREKRGLAYSVWSMFAQKQHAQLFMAGTATSNERVAESLRVISDEIARMAESGPTAEELAKAKSYLTGSYALRFDSSRKIANQLLEIRIEDLGIDYIDRRNSEVNAVTLEQARRICARLFTHATPLVVVAGRPLSLV